MWFSKVSRSKDTAPNLCSLPPTSEAFEQNVARAHLQFVAIWLHALDPNTPVLDPTYYGWSQEERSTALSPTTVPQTSLAPTGLLKLIKCSCRSEMPCNTNKCSCNSSDMACTQFCACQCGLVVESNSSCLETYKITFQS